MEKQKISSTSYAWSYIIYYNIPELPNTNIVCQIYEFIENCLASSVFCKPLLKPVILLMHAEYVPTDRGKYENTNKGFKY